MDTWAMIRGLKLQVWLAKDNYLNDPLAHECAHSILMGSKAKTSNYGIVQSSHLTHALAVFSQPRHKELCSKALTFHKTFSKLAHTAVKYQKDINNLFTRRV